MAEMRNNPLLDAVMNDSGTTDAIQSVIDKESALLSVVKQINAEIGKDPTTTTAQANASVLDRRIAQESRLLDILKQKASVSGLSGGGGNRNSELAVQTKLLEMAKERLKVEQEIASISSKGGGGERSTRTKGAGKSKTATPDADAQFRQAFGLAPREQHSKIDEEFRKAFGLGDRATEAAKAQKATGAVGAAKEVASGQSMLSKFGFGSATLVGAAMALPHAINSADRAINQPFLQARERRWEAITSIPIAGSIIASAENTRQAIANPGQRRRLLEEHAIQSYTNPIRASATREWVDRMAESRKAYAFSTSKALGEYQLPQLPSTRRETVAESRSYEENLRVMPAREKTSRAGLDLDKANSDLVGMDDAIKIATDSISKLTAITGELAAQELKIKNEGGSKMEERLGMNQLDMVRTQIQLAETEKGRTELAIKRKDMQKNVLNARFGLQSAKIEQAHANLGVAEGREQRARSQAARLGMMGFEGRLQSQLSMQMIQQMGIENAPSALISQAHAAYPETVEKMAVQGGQKVQGAFAAQAPEEYGQTVEDTTKKVDELRERIRQISSESVQQEAKAISDMLVGVAEEVFNIRIRDVTEQLESLRQNQVLQSMMPK